ncbi:DUF6178 family protein [Thermodesulfobacteriota bacterium]
MTDKTPDEKIVESEAFLDELTPEKLLALDQQNAEKIFNNLSLDRKVGLVLTAPWKRRMEIILMAADSRKLVQALPEEEVYWTIKQRGAEDSLAVISRTNHEQFQYLIDMDCWVKDCADIDKITTWYRLLSKCNESKVLEWFNRADEEFLSCSLKKLIKVFKIDEETDISEEYDRMPLYTLDNMHYFQFFNEESRLILMPILNVLFESDRIRFHSIIEGVIWDMDAEAEAEAYNWRRSRISERGYPEFDEAMDIYQPLAENDVVEPALNYKDYIREEITSKYSIKLRYGIKNTGLPDYLLQTLQLIEDSDKLDEIQRHLAHLANKIIITDGMQEREIDDMKWALKKATGYISMALEQLSAGSLHVAAGLLMVQHPTRLFRFGHSSILRLQKRAAELLQRSRLGERKLFVSFYDTPWAEVVTGLCKSRPKLFAGLVQAGDASYRDFSTLEELRKTEGALAEVSAAEALLFDKLGIDPDYLMGAFLSETALSEPVELKCSAVFLTVLAQKIVHDELRLQALQIDDARAFLQRVFTEKHADDRYGLAPTLYDDVVGLLTGRFNVTEEDRSALSGVVRVCLAVLEQEFASLVSADEIDPRYVRGLVILA